VLVEVVELRVRGVRRSREELMSATPVRGLLQMSRHRTGYYRDKSRAPLLALLLAETETKSLLEPLDEARVVKIARGAILIVGMQLHVLPIRHYLEMPQGWWIKPALPTDSRCG
jgi:hypothetical protein